MRGKNKKAQSKPKKEKIAKMSLLSQKKNINDKFFDLVQKETKTLPDKNGKWKRKGAKQLADELEISVSRLTSYIKKGSINQKDDTLFINIERVHNKKRLPKTKKTTKEFTIHNFTFDNFFKRKPFGKIKPDEQLYFKAGLYLEFSKKDKEGNYSDTTGYTIQNFPISHYSNKYPEGYEEFFEIIKEKLQQHPSLKLFRFNYFDVTKINVGSIEERIETFKTKHKKNITRKKRKK